MNRSLVYLVILFFFFQVQNGNAQSSRLDSNGIRVDKNYFIHLAKDFVPLIKSPARWTKPQWILGAGILGTASILYWQDQQIAQFWQKHQSIGMDNADKYFFDPYGKMYFTLPLMGATYLLGMATNKDKPKQVAMDFVQASLYSGILFTVIKHIGHRQRPFQSSPLNPYLWGGPITDNLEHTSFPSGHTTMAFTFAAVVGGHFKETPWIPVVAYSLAVLEGLSRMYSNEHWSSDVLIGAALGYGVGTFVVNQNKTRLKVIPILGSNNSGLMLSYPL
jgi:membrane-associated phospholipid phosphatase